MSDTEVRFTIPGNWTPERKRSYRRGKFTTRVDTPEVTQYKARAALCASQAMDGILPFEEPMSAEIVWYTPKPGSYRKHENLPWKRPDLDNLAKALMDGIDGICMTDDAVFVDLTLRKRFDHRERVEVRIWPADPDWPYDRRKDDSSE